MLPHNVDLSEKIAMKNPQSQVQTGNNELSVKSSELLKDQDIAKPSAKVAAQAARKAAAKEIPIHKKKHENELGQQVGQDALTSNSSALVAEDHFFQGDVAAEPVLLLAQADSKVVTDAGSGVTMSSSAGAVSTSAEVVSTVGNAFSAEVAEVPTVLNNFWTYVTPVSTVLAVGGVVAVNKLVSSAPSATPPAAPVLTVHSAVLNTTTPTITGTAQANSTVSVYDGTTLLGTIKVDSNGQFSFTPSTALSEATHTITAKATDASGKVSAASDAVSLTIDTTAPVLSANQPVAIHSNAGVAGDGTLELTFDGPIDPATLPLPTAFEVVIGGVTNPVTAVSVNGAVVTLTLANAVAAASLSISVTYTDPTASNDSLALQDAAGNDVANIIIATGVVADGHIRGAKVYIDTNNDGLATQDDYFVGTTDSDGRFFISSNVPSGKLVVTGGINNDTGIPNTMTLKAPEPDLSKPLAINPLTTLITSVMSSAVAADEAAAKVATAFGLPVGTDLLSLDPITAATNQATANLGLLAQKAAAQIATIVTLANATQVNAQSTVFENLATAVNNISTQSPTVSLTDSGTLTLVLSGTSLAPTDSTLTAAVSAIDQINPNSGSIADISSVQSQYLDTIAPDAPTSIVVSALTNDTTPELRVTLNTTSLDGRAVVKGDVVEIYEGAMLLGSAILSATNVANGYVLISPSSGHELTAQGDHALTVKIKDSAGTPNVSTDAKANVTIDSVAPSFTSINNAAPTNENVPAGTAVYTAATTDAHAVTYSLKANTGDVAGFDINATSGVVSLKASPNFETKPNYSFTVTATDAVGNVSEQAVTLAINNVNEAPVIISTATGTVAENADISTVVYTAVATDVDDGDTRTYSLTGTDAGLFDINATSGAVTLKASANYAAKPSYSINVVAADAAGLTAAQSVTIGVSQTVVDAPFTMTETESMTLYLINQLRHDPLGWASRLGVDLTKDTTGASVSALTNLVNLDSFVANESLFKAAQAYARVLFAANASPLVHDYGNTTQTSRDTAAGYALGAGSSISENLNSRSGQTVYSSEDIARRSVEDLFKDVGVSGATHRVTLLSDSYNELGLGYSVSSDGKVFYGAQDFATNVTSAKASYLTGFVMKDTNGDLQYNVGDGLGGVSVIVTGAKGSSYQTTTQAHGYWALQVADNDTYTIVVSGAGYSGTEVVSANVQVAETVSVDFISGQVGGWVNFERYISGTQTITENSDARITVVYQPSDAIVSGSVFSLGGADATAFTIDTQTGKVFLRTSPDYEAKTTYTIDIIQSIDGEVSASRSLTLNVKNINEAPLGVVFSNTITSLQAGNSVRTKVADLTVLDDALGNNNLTLVGADAKYFEINGGALYLKEGITLNHATQARYDVSVQASDNTLGVTVGAAYSLRVASNDLKLSVTDVQGKERPVDLNDVTSQNIQPITFGATRFDTALAILEGDTRELRVLDLHTGSSLGSRTLTAQQFVVALPGAGTQFALASFDANSQVVLSTYTSGLDATSTSLVGSALNSVTLDQAFASRTQSGAGSWDFQNSDGTYYRLGFTSGSTGSLTQYSAANVALTANIAVPVTSTTTDAEFTAYKNSKVTGGNSTLSSTVFSHEFFMQSGVLHMKEDIAFTFANQTATNHFVRYRTYSNNAWNIESATDYVMAQSTGLSNPVFGTGYNYYHLDAGGTNYLVTSGNAQNSGCLYVFKTDTNANDAIYQAAAVYNLPSNDSIEGAVYAKGTMWLNINRYDNESGGLVTTYYTLNQNEWQLTSEASYRSAFASSVKPGSVARMGSAALDMLSVLATGDSTVISDTDVLALGGDSYLVRAEVTSPSIKTGYEHWVTYDAKSKQILSQKAFKGNTDLVLRSVESSDTSYIYVQSLDVTASSNGFGAQHADGALTLYRIPVASVADVLAQAVNYGAAALTDGSYRVSYYGLAQLLGNTALDPTQTVSLSHYLPLDNGQVNLISTASNTDSSSVTSVVNHLSSSGQVTSSIVLPAPVDKVVTLGGLGTFILTQADAVAQLHALRLDSQTGSVTEIPYDAFLDLSYEIPVGLSTQFGGQGKDNISGATNGIRFVDTGNGDDSITLGNGKDIVGAGQGADRVIVTDLQKIAGDQINGGGEASTIDRVVFEPTASNSELDLGKASVHYFDAVEIGADKAGTVVILSSDAAATSDYNRNGVLGDMAVLAGSQLVNGVSVSGAALHVGQSLYFGGQTLTDGSVTGFNGNDDVIGGVGNDVLMAGSGNDTLTGGLGADRLVGDVGADTFVYRSAEELVGDQLDATAEKNTLDTLRIAAISDNQNFDLSKAASIQYIDQITFSSDRIGQNLKLSGGATGVAAYANANGDSTPGDLRVNADINLTQGVVIDGSGLTNTQVLQLDGSRMNGSDIVIAGSGNDQLIYGGGRDIYTLGNGNDRVQINRGATGLLTITDFATVSDTLDFAALAGGTNTSLTFESQNGGTLITVLESGLATGLQVLLQGVAMTPQTITGSNNWAGKPTWLGSPAGQAITLLSPNNVSTNVAQSGVAGLQSTVGANDPAQTTTTTDSIVTVVAPSVSSVESTTVSVSTSSISDFADPVTADIIQVASASASSPRVAITTQDTVLATTASTATASLVGQNNGVIETPGDHDWYKVHLTPGAYYLNLKNNIIDYTNDGQDNIYSQVPLRVVVLRDANGYALTGPISWVSGAADISTNKVLRVTSEADYFLDIYSWCPHVKGAYAFEIAQFADDSSGTTTTTRTVNIGSSATGTLDFGGDNDWFSMSLVAGHTYVFTQNGNTLADPTLSLMDAAGALIQSNDDGSLGGELQARISQWGAQKKSDAMVVQKSFGDFSSLIQYTAQTSGTYYLKAASRDDMFTGSYALKATDITSIVDTTGSSTNSHGNLQINYSANGSVDYAGDKDWYAITLNAGVTYLLRGQTVADVETRLADPVLRLYSANGQYLAFNNNLSDDPEGVGYDAGLRKNDALIIYTPSTTSTYYVEVGGANNTVGQYQVSVKALDDAPGNTSTSQKVIVNNQAISGFVEVAGDQDWYGVYLTAGVTYEFDADQAASSGLTNPYLSLRDFTGGKLSSNDDTNGVNAYIRFTATTTGLHYLAVEDAGNGTGQYRLSAKAYDDYANGISTLGVIALSNRTSGTGSGGATGRIDYGGDTDYFQITLQAGDIYTIRVQGANVDNGLTLVNSRLMGVYDESGNFIGQSGNDDFGNGRDAVLTFHATSSGTYYLAVAGSSLNDVGSYQVIVDRQTPEDILATTATTADLMLGASRASTIESVTDVDWYRVQLTKDSTYVIDMVGDVTSQMMLSDAWFKGVYDASGNLIASTSNNNYGASQNSRMVFTATASGTYYLAAGSNDGSVGDYRIAINSLSQVVSDDAGESTALGAHGTISLVNGLGTVNGSIDYARDVDWQAVQLVQGKSYEITVRGAASGMGTLLDPRLNGIYDNSGKLIVGTGADSGDGGVDVRTRFTATADATYYLAVAGTADLTGSYRVEVKPTLMTDEVEANINTKAVLAVGGNFENQIETVGDVDWVKIHLDSNQHYTLMLQGVDGSMGRLEKPAMLALVDGTGRSIGKMRYVDNAQYTAKGWVIAAREASTAYEWDSSDLPAGDYYIQVGAYAGSTGAYSLRVNASPMTVTEQQYISFGPTLSSVNGTTLPSNYYRDGHTVITDPAQITSKFSMAYDSNLTLTFANVVDGSANVRILKGAGNIRLVGTSSVISIDVNSDQVMVTGNIVTINPKVDLNPSDTYSLLIDKGAFTDGAGNAFGGLGIERQVYYLTQTTVNGGVVTDSGFKSFVDPSELVFSTGATATATAASAKAAWILMVYMDADNELESQALADLQEMASVSLPDNVKLIVKLDRAAGYSSQSFAGSNETGTATYQLTASGWTKISSITEDNMGDPATLSSFISSTKSAYAANNYGLIIWGPGGGIYGTAWDQSSAMDNLTVAELKTALTNGLGTDKLKVLAFDSSLMGLQEVLHAVKDSTGVLVASEDLIPSTGLAYGPLLQRLAMNPTMTANELAMNIVNTYADQNAGGLTTTMAAFSTAYWQQLTSQLETFANYALTKTAMTQEDWVILVDALSAVSSGPTHDVTRDYYHDLRDFMNYVKEHSAEGSPLLGPAQMIMDLLDYYVTIASVTGDSGSIGLGIYSPNGTGVTSTYAASAFSMLGAGSLTSGFAPDWDDMINRLQHNTTNNAPSNLLITPVVSTRAAGHVLELQNKTAGYKLTDDLKVASVNYTDDIWIAGNQYVLTGTDSAYFKIVDSALYLKRGTPLFYVDPNNADHQYSVTIQIKDKSLTTLGANSTQSYAVVIDHLDVAAPLITSAKQVLVNSSVGTGTVYTLTATDDVDSTLIYSLQTGGNSNLFNLNSQGQLSFKQAPNNGKYNLALLAADSAGNENVQNITVNVWSASVGPIVTSATPADDLTKVALNDNISLTFNENIVRGNGAIVLKTLAGTIVETFAENCVSISGNMLTIDPTAQLLNDTTYIVELAQGAVLDTSANQYLSGAVLDYNFKTVSSIAGVATSANDISSPVLIATEAPSTLPVAIDGTISIDFNEAVQRGSGYVLLKNSDDVVVDTIDVASNSLSFNGSTLTIAPAILMNKGNHYTLELQAGTVHDAAGNDNAGASYRFTTENSGTFHIVADYKDISIANKDLTVAGNTVMQYVKAAFDYAAIVWESVIIHSPGINTFKISVKIDDALDSLGKGGPTRTDSGLPSEGQIILNTSNLDYVKSESFKAMVVHEVGHTLGMGTMWGYYGLNAVFGEYTGVEALKVYQAWNNDNTLTYVPLEVSGGSGTANSHWRESLFGEEVMTGYQSSSSETTQLSALTVAALMDLGYVVDKSQASSSYHMAGLTPTPALDVLNSTTPSMQQTFYVI